MKGLAGVERALAVLCGSSPGGRVVRRGAMHHDLAVRGSLWLLSGARDRSRGLAKADGAFRGLKLCGMVRSDGRTRPAHEQGD